MSLAALRGSDGGGPLRSAGGFGTIGGLALGRKESPGMCAQEAHAVSYPTVAEHFRDRAPEVKGTYAEILKAAKRLGPVHEEPRKTSIHLVRKTAFAGVATRKNALILTLKSETDIKSNRIFKREQ